MKKIRLILLLALVPGAFNVLQAQVDPHFSQFYAYPLWLNPAMTGTFEGDIRANLNFKDQWAGIDNGYITSAVSAEFKATDKVSWGFNILDQSAGDIGYNYFAAYGALGYAIPISYDETKKISFGLEAGIIDRGFNLYNLQSDNQYDPVTGFNPNLPSNENFNTTSSSIFDASAGIYYYDTDPFSTAKIFGGVALAHLTDANDPFATDGIKSKLPIRLTVNGGVTLKTDWIDITPNVLYIRQQQNQIRAVDLYTEIKTDDNYGLILGVMDRLDDAIVAEAGYHLKDMVIGISYDFTTSPLTTANDGQGGFELSIRYIFSKSGPGSTSNISF
jgi:type IX secretion system PorP/SprF family membrane protein